MATSMPTPGYGFATSCEVVKEVTFNTAVTAGSINLPFATNQITPANKPVKRVGVRKVVGSTPAGAGEFEITGSIELEMEPDTCGFLLGMALGSDTVTSASSGFYSHAMSMASPLDSFTLTNDYNKGSLYQFSGVKVDGLDLSAKPNGFLSGKFSLAGASETIIPSASISPTFGTLQPFEFEYINSSTINGVFTPLTDFSISLKNNLKPTWTSASGRYVRSILETQRMVSGSATALYESDAVAQLVLGTGSPIFAPVSVSFQYPGSNYAITLFMPNCMIESAPLDPKRTDFLTYAIKFTAYQYAVAGDDLQVTLVNQVSTSLV
jgi:hypothetical protein